MRRFPLIGILGGLAVCLAGIPAMFSPPGSGLVSAAGSLQPPIVNARAFAGLGRLAIVWRDYLYVLDGGVGVSPGFRRIPRDGFAWSPTRDVLAVRTATSIGSHQLSAVRPDGRLTPLTGRDDVGSFAWSPDGRAVAYTATQHAPSRHDALNNVAAGGGWSTRRFEAPATTGMAQWMTTRELWLAARDGTAARRIERAGKFLRPRRLV